MWFLMLTPLSLFLYLIIRDINLVGLYLFLHSSQVCKLTTTPWPAVKTDYEWWVYISQAYLGANWIRWLILYCLQKFILRCFPFNTHQVVFLYRETFHFTCWFWYQPRCPVYNSTDVLIVGLAFKISIPFRNPHAGVEEISSLEQ
jgi:hypothetical protein